MAKKNEPTPKQTSLLENLGLTAPPTKATCRRLIAYVMEGNGSRGEDKQHRIAISKKYQRDWLGQRVRDMGPGKRGEGIVLYLMARNREEVDFIRHNHPEDGKAPQPFHAHVKWDNQPASDAGLSFLEQLSPQTT